MKRTTAASLPLNFHGLTYVDAVLAAQNEELMIAGNNYHHIP